jgi:hypothetical protein
MPNRRLLLLALLLGGVSGPAMTQASLPTPAALAELASHRFPQPVRAGDLVGRRLLAPSEGRVVSAARNGARLDLLVQTGGVLGLGGRTVVVPMDAIALLGEHVALLDITPEQLQTLPGADAAETPVGVDETIRVGLVKPFH